MLFAPLVIRLLDLHAPWSSLPLCPGMSAWAAASELPIWEALEAENQAPVAPPMFALCWPGSLALGALILDGRLPVGGLRVLDVGCGSGVAAAAAALKGAHATAADLDPLACFSAQELARRHHVQVETCVGNPLRDDALGAGFDVILGGDLFYNQPTAVDGAQAVARWRKAGARVVLADAGRPFFNACGLPQVASFDVNVPGTVEGVSHRTVRVFSS